jgi:hypothetical protein
MPELTVGQAGKELTHNQALAILDQLAQAVVVDKDLATPPGSPANGALYIVAAGATGAWTGQSGNLAFWLTSVAAWTFITPANGWRVWVNDESLNYSRVGGAWVLSSIGDVVGPASTTTGNIPLYADGTGKLLNAGLQIATQSDTTAGRVTVVGYQGLGAGVSYTNADLDSLTTPMRGFVSNGSPVNYPGGFNSGNVQVFANGPVNALTQVFYPINQRERSFFRTFFSGWGQWCEHFNSIRGGTVTVDTGSLGFATGSAGTVTQATNKSTGVTLNKPSGQITMNAASLAANTAVSFTLTNSTIAANDTPYPVIKSGATAGAYLLQVDAVAAGSCRISLRNMTGGALAEAVVLQFNLIKGAIA